MSAEDAGDGGGEEAKDGGDGDVNGVPDDAKPDGEADGRADEDKAGDAKKSDGEDGEMSSADETGAPGKAEGKGDEKGAAAGGAENGDEVDAAASEPGKVGDKTAEAGGAGGGAEHRRGRPSRTKRAGVEGEKPARKPTGRPRGRPKKDAPSEAVTEDAAVGVKRSRSGRVIKRGWNAKDEEDGLTGGGASVGASSKIKKAAGGTGRGRSEAPLFCACQKPWREDDEEEMIACDGEGCKYEWYHWSCVGIKAAPKGRYFCDACRAKWTGRRRRKSSP